MKNLILLLTCFSLISSCDKDEPATPQTSTSSNTTTPPQENGSITFSVDGVEIIGVQNAISIMKVANTNDKYIFQLSAYDKIPTAEFDYKLISISIAPSSMSSTSHFTAQPRNYLIPNYSVYDSLQGRSLTYSIGTSIVYNNVSCDATFQGGSNFGTLGELKITSIDMINKKINGTFSCSVCKSATEQSFITGSFTNFTFLLIQ